MILSTHAVVGAALASFLPSQPWAPYAAAVIGFASHFLIDAIPHWDYPIRSASVHPNSREPIRFDRALLRDLIVIGFDGLAGALAAVALFGSSSTLAVILIAAIAAMFPDPLQFAHSRFPREPLRTLQRFHVWIHTNHRLERQVLLGVSSQLAFVVAVVMLTMYLHRAVLGDIGTFGWGSM